jgi:hypothetical protein
MLEGQVQGVVEKYIVVEVAESKRLCINAAPFSYTQATV